MNHLKTNINTDSSGGVKLEGIDLSFGNTHVLKGIDLQIKPGEFFAFLGPSGCGKTTLLRVIAGFESAQAGRVLIGDQDISHLPPWKRDLGMVFQSYALWPHMTVRKNVAFGLEERRMPRKEINKRVDKALELVSLGDLADRRPSQLSGGQQQRVALARTIVIEPKVLLLDEPLSNLDAKLRVQMRLELRELQRTLSVTTIFVTHDQEEANTTSDRIAVLNDGIVQQVDTPANLYDNPSNLFVANFLGVTNVVPGIVMEENNKLFFRSSDNKIIVPLSKGTQGSSNIVFRPQNLRIRPEEAEPVNGATKLIGKVDHMEFIGSLVRYRVRVGEYFILVDAAHQKGEDTLSVGKSIALYLNNDQVIQLSH
ncbi:MAG: ABC transporter ATP-binding protein [Desulfobacula sp.]|uniref:ABC transporter ATP-binding protein n=1 Tax=Desulfobacula sp. TaxID=2593537 RepID=UPI0025C68A38|nr:ABC transporter ATP-binding protein [Desulfobacula sp.]MCD4721438.1 ABC transporter ATP-binding protein [Desulfobacula sp.]